MTCFSHPRRLHLKHWLAAGACLLAGGTTWAADRQQAQWADFKRHFLRDGGRIVSDDGALGRTYSEGQAYGLFFALIHRDRQTFDAILRWTEQALCAGDIGQQLPAWLWGQTSDQRRGVLDANSASDADVWIAYTLIEAGRIFDHGAYTILGQRMARMIVERECAQLPGLGLTLLPGQHGFAFADRWKLNPSYCPLQLLQRLGHVQPQWQAILHSSRQLIAGASPRGVCADWVWYDAQGKFSQDRQGEAQGRGGYNAIRTYLWAGMLPAQSADLRTLRQLLAPMLRLVGQLGYVPEYTNPWTLEHEGKGPPGFAAALLPFAQASNDQAVQAQLQRSLRQAPVRSTAYYEQCLQLFAQAWITGLYRFDAQGRLVLEQ